MNAVLLDTNVWLDYHLADRLRHKEAFALVDAALRNDIPLLVASHSLKDFWYIFWQHSKKNILAHENVSKEDASRVAKKFAWACLEHTLQIATVVGSDASDAWLALKMQNTHDDYEDNLVVAASMRSNARLLVTSDQTLLSRCPVATVTPADALSFLDLVEDIR